MATVSKPVSPKKLSPAQRSHLKSLAHHLDPIVMVGKEGLGDNVATAVAQALLDHELVKVKLGKSSSEDRQAIVSKLVQSVLAHEIALVGKILILYKAHPDKPVIKLPKR